MTPDPDPATGSDTDPPDAHRQLAQDVASCRGCRRLVRYRERVARERRAAFADQEYWGRGVPGFGDPDAAIMVIGLAPAAHGANRTGRMFTGDRSGDMLFACLHRLGLANQPNATAIDDGLQLSNVWVTSPVKCAPPDNKPTTIERDRCVGRFLGREVATVNPRVYVALGRFGWDVTCRLGGWDGRKPVFGHGAVAPLADGRMLVGSYHVSQYNTFTGRLDDDMLDAVFTQAVDLATPA